MTNKIDDLLNSLLFGRIVKQLPALHCKDMGKRQIFELLFEIDPFLTFMIDQMPCDIQLSLAITYCLFNSLEDVYKNLMLNNVAKAGALQSIQNILKSGLATKDQSPVIWWSIDLLLQQLARLSEELQTTIISGVSNAALGMADFVGRDIHTCADYNLFCHHRRGCLGLTVVRIICLAHKDNPSLANVEHLSGSIEIFTAKTRIIGEVLDKAAGEQIVWPREIWNIYTNYGFDSLVHDSKSFEFCLNHMIYDALKHLPAIYQFLSRLRNFKVFRFLCTDVVEAVQHLSKLYRNTNRQKTITPLSVGTKYTLYKNLFGLSDFQDLIGFEIDRLSLDIKPGDPIGGQMKLLLAQIKMVCSRRRNKSLSITSRSLSIGVILELIVHGLIGLLIAIFLIKQFG